MSGHELVYRAVNQILLHFELGGKRALLHFRIFKKESTHLLSRGDGSFSAMRLAESFCNIIRHKKAEINREIEERNRKCMMHHRKKFMNMTVTAL